MPSPYYGGESIAIRDSDNLTLLPTHQGTILQLDTNTGVFTPYVEHKGHPLGLEFDQVGNLIIADAEKGLLKVTADKTIQVLTNTFDGDAYGFVDDLDIASDGKIYFSDASAKQWIRDHNAPPYRASQFDIIEHGGHGRLYVYDPTTQTTELLLDGIQFANGVALSANEDFVLVNETGSYRVLRYWLKGELAGTSDVFISNLPGFPDNITRTHNGGFWLALAKPRNALLDALSNWPLLRASVTRLPAFMAPVGKDYDYVLRLDASGRVLQTLQDPDAAIGMITSAIEHNNRVYLGSLTSNKVGIYTKPNGF
jgi:sugar lactone lactonase YvrE